MIDLIKDTPVEYSKQSRDYQVFRGVYNSIFNQVKMYTDLINGIWTDHIDNKLLDLRSYTLNFIPKFEWDNDDLRGVTNCFRHLLRTKGTKGAIKECLEILSRVHGISLGITDVELTEDGAVQLTISEDIADIGNIEDLFRYILPAGLTYEIIKYKVIDSAAQANIVVDNRLYVDSEYATSELYLPNSKKGYAIPRKLATSESSGSLVDYSTGMIVTDGKERDLPFSAVKIIVKANNNSKEYGQPDPALSASAVTEGFPLPVSTAGMKLDIAREPGEEAKTYTINVSGDSEQGMYTITHFEPGTFTITRRKATIVADDITVTYGETPSFTMSIVSVLNNDIATVRNKFSLYTSESDISRVGRYTIYVSGDSESNEPVLKNYYFNKVSGVLNVVQRIVNVVANNLSKVYGESDPTFTVTITPDVTVDYTTSRTPGEDVGNYTITVTGETSQGDYSVQYHNGQLTITAKPLRITSNSNSFIYDGQEHSDLGFTTEGFVNGEGAYAISGTTIKNVGTAENVLVLNANPNTKLSNYSITQVNGTLEVTQRPVTVIPNSETIIYGDPIEEPTVTIDNIVPGEEDLISYDLEYGTPKNVGEYPITASGEPDQGNYAISFNQEGKIVINKRPVTIKSPSATKTYDGQPLKADTLTIDGFVGDEGITNISTSEVTNAGTYDNTFTYDFKANTLESNYIVTSEYGTLTINPLTINITNIQGLNKSIVYNGSEQTYLAFTAETSSPLYDINQLKYNGEGAKGVNARTYSMGLDASKFDLDSPNFRMGMCQVSKDGSLTITKRPMEITINGKTSEATYDGTNQRELVTGYAAVCTDSDTLTRSLFNSVYVNGTDFTLGGEAKNVGTYRSSITDVTSFRYSDNNISPTFTPGSQIELVIKRKDAKIKADNKEITRGEPLPELTATIDGIVDGTLLDYDLTCSYDPVFDSEGSSYDIICTLNGEYPNYDITVENGVLTVN